MPDRPAATAAPAAATVVVCHGVGPSRRALERRRGRGRPAPMRRRRPALRSSSPAASSSGATAAVVPRQARRASSTSNGGRSVLAARPAARPGGSAVPSLSGPAERRKRWLSPACSISPARSAASSVLRAGAAAARRRPVRCELDAVVGRGEQMSKCWPSVVGGLGEEGVLDLGGQRHLAEQRYTAGALVVGERLRQLDQGERVPGVTLTSWRRSVAGMPASSRPRRPRRGPSSRSSGRPAPSKRCPPSIR